MKTRENTLDEYIVKEQTQYTNKLKLSNEDIILDIGANIGASSAVFSPLVKKVIAFEPDIENYNLLVENTKQFNNVITINSAIVGNDDKQREFFINNKKNKGTHSFFVKRGRDKIIVNCININDVINKFNPNKIKMDVEGAEYEILKSFDNLNNLKELILEYHFNCLRDKNHIKYFEIINLLKSNFKNVLYKENINKNWATLIYCNNL